MPSEPDDAQPTIALRPATASIARAPTAGGAVAARPAACSADLPADRTVAHPASRSVGFAPRPWTPAFRLAYRPAGELPSRIVVTARSEAARDLLKANRGWLRGRWLAAFEAQAQATGVGAALPVPAWFYEPATGALVQAIHDAGLEVSFDATRGQMTDLVDLFRPPEGELEDILSFFELRLPAATRNRARARHEAARLLADPARLAAWRGRLALQLQHEFYRRIGRTRPEGLGFWGVHSQMEEMLRGVPGHVQRQWTTLATIVWEFDRAAFLRSRRLPRPGLDSLLGALRELRQRGLAWERLDAPTVAAFLRSRLTPSLDKKEKAS